MPESPPVNLVFLRRLVTVLTAVMILGIVTVTALLVIRLQSPIPPALPETIDLPDGATAVGFTVAPNWYAVVTADDRILVFERRTGKLHRTIEVTP